MPSTLARRPLPALVALLALLLLTALVWWRVLHRGASGSAAATCPTQTTTAPVATLPAPSSITLRVLNSTDRTGIAGHARTTLVADGFRIPGPAANDNPRAKIKGTAEIRYGTRGKSAAALVRYYFPGAKLVHTPGKSAVVVVSLGQRYRSVATQQHVQAALRADGVALAGVASSTPSSSPSC
jgi:hypothetical protein